MRRRRSNPAVFRKVPGLSAPQMLRVAQQLRRFEVIFLEQAGLPSNADLPASVRVGRAGLGTELIKFNASRGFCDSA